MAIGFANIADVINFISP